MAFNFNNAGEHWRVVMRRYDGRLRTEDQCYVARSLLDNFSRMVESDGSMPEVGFSVKGFKRLPTSNIPNFVLPNGFVRYHSDITCSYQIDRIASDLHFIMVADCLIDMRIKCNRAGNRVVGYGTEWIKVGIPVPAFDGICNHIEEQTRYSVDRSNFKETSDGLYVTTIASFPGTYPPRIVLHTITDLTEAANSGDWMGGGGDFIFIDREDKTVAEMYKEKRIKDVESAHIAFSMGLTVVLPQESTGVPQDSFVKLKFSMVSVRTTVSSEPSPAPIRLLQYFNLDEPF